jgi:RHS repeat-associated protein
MTDMPFFNVGNINGRLNIIYNIENMPTLINTGSGTTVNFIYDGDGVRSKKIVQGKNTTYYLGKHFEITDNGVTTKYVFAGAIRLAMIKVTDVYYFHKDRLGSTTAVTDNNGELIERIEYFPSGIQSYHAGDSVVKYLFTDQEYDNETGLYNYNARLYDPVLGRFITPDTIVQNPFDPQMLNRYTYVRNNPLMYIDPSGHFLEFIIGGIIFGAISSGIQSDWDLEATLVGAFIGGVSGGAGAWAGGLVGGGVGGAMLGGAVAGATAGGLNAAYYDGDILTAMFSGATLGAIGGAAFGGISDYYKGEWGLGRAVLHGAVGGGLAEAGGGDFRHGFTLSAGSAMLMWGWQEAKNWTNTSSLKGSGKHRYLNGKLLTAGTRKCIGCTEENQNWFTKTGMGEEGAEYNKFIVEYKPDSAFGQFIEYTSKLHDWFNGWGYKGTGNYIAGSELYNTAFQSYSMAGMLPASIITGGAFSATVYQPIIY